MIKMLRTGAYTGIYRFGHRRRPALHVHRAPAANAGDRPLELLSFSRVYRSRQEKIMTGRVEPKKHDSGSQANETLDGLDSYAESTRKGAEDKPIGQKNQMDDMPVFDRGDALPP